MRMLMFFLAVFFIARAHAWTIEKTQGTVKLAEGKKSPEVPLSGTEFKPGVTVTTGADGKAFIRDGESELWLAPKSQLFFKNAPDDENDLKGQFEVKVGKVRAKFKRPSGPVSFSYEVRAKSVIASVRGTEFIVLFEEKEERVATFEGSVRVTSLKSAAESWDVPAGRALVVKPNEMPKVRDTSGDSKKSLTEATTF